VTRQAHFDLIAAKLLEAFGDLIVDKQVMGSSLDLLLGGVPLFEELRQG
jgi:hypothetical protein